VNLSMKRSVKQVKDFLKINWLLIVLVNLSLFFASMTWVFFNWQSLAINNTVIELNRGNLDIESIKPSLQMWIANGKVRAISPIFSIISMIASLVSLYAATLIFACRRSGKNPLDVFKAVYWSYFSNTP